MKQTILIVDDEEDIRAILSYNLIKEGYEVLMAVNGHEALDIAIKTKPDLILLDVMMPEMDGIEVCEILRSNASLDNTIICFLTARNEDYSQVAGFDSGADDYVSKPIKPKVLISRIKALIRRKKPAKPELDLLPELSINRDKYVVEKGLEEIQLPRKEFELIALLLSEPNIVFHRNDILNKVWGTEIIVGDRTIDVHVRKLREKLGNEYIQTIKGVGYKYSIQKKSAKT